MKYIPVLLLSLLFLGNPTPPADDSFVMIQLFTSQGCSSCPPADRLVETIKEEYKNQNVYVLSYHVDYWNRLGWKDPFSKQEFTQLQYNYADQFQERRVYTPQIVVNGSEHFVGSDGYKLRKRIQSYLKNDVQNKIAIQSKKEGKNIHFTIQVAGDTQNKQLKLASLLNNSITEVTRGENSNRTLSNSNIVLDEKIVTLDENNTAKFSVTLGNTEAQKDMALIAFVQDEELKITGATRVSL
jgi:hypothetical protein